ncbi:high affinity cGMP-specific 3',5'-cyclic phosphodiesterase 9A-like isoform X2 [Pelobates fuscus]|uniref:high affinity cGMP-specific 3',5'-cyclic phosphodiesterase 9A-like isoform X2 n=1 Tax=Pelobates fuscus TaxID=191477 RepID=UPI002FE45F8D
MENNTDSPCHLSLQTINKSAKLPESIRKALRTRTLNVWEIKPDQMLTYLEHMFYELDLVTQFKMEPEILKYFLRCVQNNYRDNPFHNFRHGFCVTQMMYCVIWACELQGCLTAADTVSLMVASLCHDLDHPGLNNAYQVNACTELASRFQNKSPLENHHWAVTSQILSQPQSNILLHADTEDVQQILKSIKDLILATDMSHHSEILRTLQQTEILNLSNAEHVTMLKKSLIKFCDISNEARPADQADIWADALFEEYFIQSDREKAEDLPVTPYMDRDIVSKAESQSSFISFLIIPLCQTLGKILPQLNTLMMEPLSEAKQRYQEQMEAQKAAL